MPSALARLAEREPQASAALLEVRAERIDRGKLDDLRKLGLDRSINVDRKSHAIDNAGLDDHHRAFERALNALFLDRMWRGRQLRCRVARGRFGPQELAWIVHPAIRR